MHKRAGVGHQNYTSKFHIADFSAKSAKMTDGRRLKQNRTLAGGATLFMAHIAFNFGCTISCTEIKLIHNVGVP